MSNELVSFIAATCLVIITILLVIAFFSDTQTF